LDAQEEEEILSKFAMIESKQDYLALRETLTQKLIEKQQELLEDIPSSSDANDMAK
jgi:vacuolar-type H+-ATPase subunit E/Vma4